MRIDKFLKVSRIIKRRTVANDACDAAHVSVNGRTVKASYDVKEGDIYNFDIENHKVSIYQNEELLLERIKGEERFLENELEGYKEYKEKVKYRMIPFVW